MKAGICLPFLAYVHVVFATPVPAPYDILSHSNNDDPTGTSSMLHHLVNAEDNVLHIVHPDGTTHTLNLTSSSTPKSNKGAAFGTGSSSIGNGDVSPYTKSAHTLGGMMHPTGQSSHYPTEPSMLPSGAGAPDAVAMSSTPAPSSLGSHSARVGNNATIGTDNAAAAAELPVNGTASKAVGGPLAHILHPLPGANTTDAPPSSGPSPYDVPNDPHKNTTNASEQAAPAGGPTIDAGNPANKSDPSADKDKKPDLSDDHKVCN